MSVAVPRTPWSGHLWTVVPTVRDLLLRPRERAQVDVVVPIVDEWFGPTVLSASLAAPAAAEDVVVVVHGLGGDRHTAYVQRAVRTLVAAGFAVLAVDLRGADRRGGGFYHVALTDDLAAVCRSPLLQSYRRVFVLGFSMGGHVALHFAAAGTEPRLAGTAALCTPLDLQATQAHLDRPARAFYRHYVLRGLKAIYDATAARHDVPAPAAEVRACRTFHEWDRLTITRRYGYATPAAFYERNSARHALPRLRADTVLVTALDDPIVPPFLVQPYLDAAVPGRLRACFVRGGHLQFPRGQDLGLGSGAAGRPVVEQLARWFARDRGAPLSA